MKISAKAASGLSTEATARFDPLFASDDRSNAPGASAIVIHRGGTTGFHTRIE